MSGHRSAFQPNLDLEESPEESSGSTGDQVVDEATRRFRRCSEWEAPARQRFIEDLKFRHGDADNGYQWPNAVRRSRDVDAKPCLTINILRQHNLMITNEMRRNKAEIKIIGTGNGATAESAGMMDQIVSQIQWSSQAQNAYTLARAFQVDGGIGWWRLVTRYVEGEFYQEILIEEVADPLSVYVDPDAQKIDKSDARFGFVFDLVAKDEFNETYPKFRDLASIAPLGTLSSDDDWITKDHVRVAEYFRIVEKDDLLVGFDDPISGVSKRVLKSRLPKSVLDAVLNLPRTMTRPVREPTVEWYLIVGQQRVDHTIWPGRYIPLIPVIGEETVIEGIMDRKGHTRAMKDAQRMYNYNSSAQIEFVALQGKTPWTASAASIEEHETQWNTANTQNHSVLVFNHLDDDGNPLPVQALPNRTQPPNASPAFEAGMQTAFNQMMFASGQYQNQMGMQGNERTGVAIQEREDQGDTATYHFKDNFDTALVFTGVQILDLLPKVYDSPRVIQIQADGDLNYDLTINPAARAAFQARRAWDGQIVERVLNPQIGRYALRAAAGNAFGSRRQETVNALTLILTQAPALTGIIGDLLLSAMDFKEAQEAAGRLRRMVPPQALGEGPSPGEQQAQQQIVQLRAALAESLQKLGKEQVKLVGKDQMRDIDAYKAETERFRALADQLGLDSEAMRQTIEQLVRDAAQTHLVPILKANMPTIDPEGNAQMPSGGQPPLPGASLAPDGEWYLTDPTRKGKYMRVAPLAQERGTRNIISNV